MTGRFIAFLWMIVGLAIFAFFTSTVTGLVAELKAEHFSLPVEEVYRKVVLNRARLCTARGIHAAMIGGLDVIPSGGMVLDNIESCYVEAAAHNDVVILYDRPTLFFDLQKRKSQTAYLGNFRASYVNLSISEALAEEWQWQLEPLLRAGVTISEPLRRTYAAVAFPHDSSASGDEAPGLSHQIVVNRALSFVLNYQGGIFLNKDRSSGNSAPMDTGWSIEESRRMWLLGDLANLDASVVLPEESQSGSSSMSTGFILLIIAAVVLGVYLSVQFGGLYLRRRRKIRRIMQGISRMPSGLKDPSELPFTFEDPSPEAIEKQKLCRELSQCKDEISNLKVMLNELMAAQQQVLGTLNQHGINHGSGCVHESLVKRSIRGVSALASSISFPTIGRRHDSHLIHNNSTEIEEQKSPDRENFPRKLHFESPQST